MTQADAMPASGAYTPDEFLDKLRKALRSDGDFPASAKVVSELRRLTQNPKTTSNQITEIILKEPSLGTRILSLVNSSFYRRRKPIMTISQAVVQMGMKPLSELCAGLILLQKFVPNARRSGPFANCLKKTVLTSLLSSSISRSMGGGGPNSSDETGYLAGSFAELGVLLLAYYFPKVYESAIKRSETKKQDLEKSIKEITGLHPLQISKEVIIALELPDFYNKIIDLSERTKSVTTTGMIGEQLQIAELARSLHAARGISEVLTSGKGKPDLDSKLAALSKELKLSDKILPDVLGSLTTLFKDHCASIEVDLPSLPPYIQTFAGAGKTSGADSDEAGTPQVDNAFMSFVDEIRQAVENREPTAAIITTVMETLAWGLGFNRVLLMLLDGQRKFLMGRMMLGQSTGFDPTQIRRPVGPEAGPLACDAMAFREFRPVFTGDPVIKDGWPFAAVPVGFGPRAIGVVYADKVGSSEAELGAKEQAAIGVLAELLDRSLTISSKG